MKKLCGAGLTAGLLILSGCSNDNFIPTVSPTISSFSVFNTRQSTGTVVLPSGSKLSPQDVRVISSVSTGVQPNSSGVFTLTTYDDGTELGLVLSPAGNPMLMGFLDSTHKTLSADSTALALAYTALGGYEMLNESDRQEMIAQISALPQFAALSQTVASEIVANPDNFAQRDTNLTTALNTFFMGVTGVTPIQLAPVGGQPEAILINPSSAQSGVTMIQQPPFGAQMMNAYRRRTHTFVSRVSDVTINPQGIKTVTLNPGDLTDFELIPSVGLTGGVTGSVVQIFNAYFGNSTTAYAPTTSSTFQMPLTTGYDQTNYTVLNVGPGGMGQSQLGTLTKNQHTILVQTAVNSLVDDAMIPFLSNVLFGNGFLGDASGKVVAGQANFRSTFITNLEKDILNLIPTLPLTENKILAGDYHGALNDLLFNAYNGATVRDFVEQAAQDAATASGFNPVPFQDAIQKFNVLMNSAGTGLQIFDTSVFTLQLAASDVVDTWSVVASTNKTVLSPASSTLSAAGNVALTVTVPGVTLTGNNYSYLWTDTATVGTLTEVGGGGRTGQTSYCSSSTQAQYVVTSAQFAALTANANDTVAVTVFSGANCVAANALGAPGTATVAITTSGLLNGDFSQGLTYWNQTNGGFAINTNESYGNNDCYPAQDGNPFAQGLAYGSDVSLEQTFTMPGSATSLSLRTWNNLDPVQVTVSLIQNGSEIVLGSLQPPSLQKLSNPNDYYSVVCTGNSSANLTYDITQFAGKAVTLRLRAAYVGGINGTFGNFDDVVVK